MHGFTGRHIWLHWVVAAALMSGLVFRVERELGNSVELVQLGALVGLLCARIAWWRERRDPGHAVVTVATLCAANTFIVALLVGDALTRGEAATAPHATYRTLIQVFVFGFGYLLLALSVNRSRFGARPAAEQQRAATGSTSR